ncbi:hypothetical protein IQ07DRAFT_637945 [Pyrenochaeta sp. DS3sAY3a]|nr:hypothetical protein IQ07DRAFT_637945 [Pyrenochaeta sp. DS3sAY3a]
MASQNHNRWPRDRCTLCLESTSHVTHQRVYTLEHMNSFLTEDNLYLEQQLAHAEEENEMLQAQLAKTNAKIENSLTLLTGSREFEENLSRTLVKLEMGVQQLQRLSNGDSGVNLGCEKEGEDDAPDGSAGVQVDAEAEAEAEAKDAAYVEAYVEAYVAAARSNLPARTGHVGLDISLPKQD